MDQLDLASTSLRHEGLGQTGIRLQYLKSADADSDPEQLRAATRELEAYFLHVLIREMRKTVPRNEILNGGKAEEIFQDFLDEQIALEMARSGRFGLADSIYADLENLLKQSPKNADIEKGHDYA